MIVVDFHHVELPPPPKTQHVHTHIQTDGDYTKRVVTPFGTTRLKNKKNRTCTRVEVGELGGRYSFAVIVSAQEVEGRQVSDVRAFYQLVHVHVVGDAPGMKSKAVWLNLSSFSFKCNDFQEDNQEAATGQVSGFPLLSPLVHFLTTAANKIDTNWWTWQVQNKTQSARDYCCVTSLDLELHFCVPDLYSNQRRGYCHWCRVCETVICSLLWHFIATWTTYWLVRYQRNKAALCSFQNIKFKGNSHSEIPVVDSGPKLRFHIEL